MHSHFADSRVQNVNGILFQDYIPSSLVGVDTLMLRQQSFLSGVHMGCGHLI